jgi:protein-S-isoprenylcysteine O-methyltransferase Ste14
MKFATLIIGITLIACISWFYSIKGKRYHGVTRFFSFVSIYILVLLNFKTWFSDPFSVHQIISWVFLLASVYPGVAGFITLKTRGKSVDNFENTTVLVTSGIYRYIRHPLYCSLLLLGTGVVFKDTSSLQLILGAVNITALYFTARIEEGEMSMKFGEQYLEYMKDTKMFIPFVW